MNYVEIDIQKRRSVCVAQDRRGRRLAFHLTRAGLATYAACKPSLYGSVRDVVPST
jgi:hypothetical protein